MGVYQLEVNRNDTIKSVKIKIEHKSPVPVADQRLICFTTVLDDHMSLADYGIQPDSTLHIVTHVPGGGTIYDCVSDCPECPGKSCCEIFDMICLNKPFASEDTWIALCDAFNVSKAIRKIVKENSECPKVRCADIIHRLHHADPTLKFRSTVEAYMK